MSITRDDGTPERPKYVIDFAEYLRSLRDYALEVYQILLIHRLVYRFQSLHAQAMVI
jgi:hypothetical protein